MPSAVEPPSEPPVALVIDDEVPLRELVSRMLEPEVCRVLHASDAEGGLRAIELGDPRVDVVLTDFVMPGLDGLDVVEVLAEYRPTVPVAIVSAHAGSIYQVQRRLGGQLRVLQKPFSEDAVRSLTVGLIAEARALRQQAEDQHAYAGDGRVDLVSAAWAIHHSRQQKS